jgi:CRISPR-associated protein Cmr5
MKESLDQQRARFAWEKVTGWVKDHPDRDDYAKLAKGAPALIMQSGLMPVFAFYRDKGKEKEKKAKTPHDWLLKHLCEWLHTQFKDRIKDAEFATVMTALMGNSADNAAEHARFYQQATAETMALLRWIRQFAAAMCVGKGGFGG